VIWESRARETSAKVALGRVLINVQIAAGYALAWLVQKMHSLKEIDERAMLADCGSAFKKGWLS
jgi:hypothetical protein